MTPLLSRPFKNVHLRLGVHSQINVYSHFKILLFFLIFQNHFLESKSGKNFFEIFLAKKTN
jgi:hypothetical protein